MSDMKNKENKYRLVKDTNNMCRPPNVDYVIEKRVRFLFWTWWSRDYLFDVSGRYSTKDLHDAQNRLAILNGEKEWVSTEVLS